jgi:hypothetical protein
MSFIRSFAFALQRHLLDPLPGEDAVEIRRAAILGYMLGREVTAGEIAHGLSLPLEDVLGDLSFMAHMDPPRCEAWAPHSNDLVLWSLPEHVDKIAREAAGAVMLAGQPAPQSTTQAG